jgi:PTS system glucose-specific IIA component
MAFLSKIKSLISKEKQCVTIAIRAPLSGNIIPIEEVPDLVFAEKIVGDGVAIVPSGDMMVAPCNGTIGQIFDTNHAFSMQSDTGIELFVHFGIDTVKLKGKGFSRIASAGQKVKAGDPVIGFDLAYLTQHAVSVITPVVISNMDEITKLNKFSGNVIKGQSLVLEIIK